jgi:hypothetical protein
LVQDGHQSLAAHDDAIKEAVVLCRDRQCTELSLLFDQPHHGLLTGGIRGPFRIDVAQPLRALLCQVGIIMKGASRDEVPFDVFDQVLDRSFLVSGRRCTRLRMKFELHSQFLISWIPDRLVLGVATQHRRFQNIRHHNPGHATNRLETANQAA